MQEVREFRTWASSLRELREWLADQDVSQVAMEATGVYWRPVWAELESLGRVESVSAGFLEKLVRNGEIALLQQPKERVLLPFGSIEASVAFGPRPLFLRLRR